MRNKIVILNALLLTVFMLPSCTTTQEKSTVYTLGFAVSTSIASTNGTVQADAVFASVALDGNSRITACKLDMNQPATSIVNGIIPDTAPEFQTKMELGNAYGMRAASKIGKEWYEQAEYFCQTIVGKTKEEVAGIGKDEILLSGCTVDNTGMIEVVVSACENARYTFTSPAAFTLGLSTVTTLKDAANATETADGKCGLYTVYSSVAVDKEGKVLCAALDMAQPLITFNAAGEITNTTNSVPTKQELKEAYGMKAASKINKEWYEQADYLTSFIVGKTAEQITNMTADDQTLLAGCTVQINEYQVALSKAIKNAK